MSDDRQNGACLVNTLTHPHEPDPQPVVGLVLMLILAFLIIRARNNSHV